MDPLEILCQAIGVFLKLESKTGIMRIQIDPSKALDMCFRTLGSYGIISVYASGNSTLNIDIANTDSAYYTNLPEEITVNSSTNKGAGSYFSDYGIRSTDIYAPGSSIISTIPGNMAELYCDIGYSPAVKDVKGSPAADECMIRLWDRSGVECAYIRFALWQGDAQLGYVLSCPNEGEDFCRCPVYADQMKTVDGEPAEPLRIVLSFGYSEQEPEDAILSAMMGNPVTEEECCEMTLEPAFGEFADYELVSDETGGYTLVPVQ